jgi:hypothetical protein
MEFSEETGLNWRVTIPLYGDSALAGRFMSDNGPIRNLRSFSL